MSTPTALAPKPRRDQATAPPARVAKALDQLEVEIGGREALIAALSHAPKSRDLAYVLGLIGDPKEAKVSLAVLCAAGGITAGELIDAYKSGEINRAQAVATSKIGEKLAEVAEDTMRLSLTHDTVCHACLGTCTFTPEPTKKQPNPQPGPCETCRGIGKLVVGGDLEHKKLALEMGKLLSKGGGVQIAVSQQVGVQFGTAGGALEALQAATDRVLYGDGAAPPVVEAEVLEETEDSILNPAVEEGDWREDPHP